MSNKLPIKKIWLDLELREDIDDYLTLLFALDNDYEIMGISINNPSIEEIKLTYFTLKECNVEIPLYFSGEITKYSEEKNIKSFLKEKIKDIDEKISVLSFKKLEENLKIIKLTESIVFCGGSLTTLALFIDNKENDFEAWIQGGFASYEIVPEDMILKKFKKRKSVPSWNLNLDIKSTEKVLSSKIVKHFVSKNICHNSWISESDLDKENRFTKILREYFKNTKYKDKCLHDVLALISIKNDIVGFKEVELKKDDSLNPKWYSIGKESTNTFISISCDFEEFKKIIKK